MSIITVSTKTITRFFDESFKNQVRASSSSKFLMKLSKFLMTKKENIAGADDHTHSLPHSKICAWTWAKCKDVFITSQHFAAHVSSFHYKHETIAEMQRRFCAKFKKINLCLVHSRDGITIVPDLLLAKTLKWRRMKGKKAVKINGNLPSKIEDYDKNQMKKLKIFLNLHNDLSRFTKLIHSSHDINYEK